MGLMWSKFYLYHLVESPWNGVIKQACAETVSKQW